MTESQEKSSEPKRRYDQLLKEISPIKQQRSDLLSLKYQIHIYLLLHPDVSNCLQNNRGYAYHGYFSC